MEYLMLNKKAVACMRLSAVVSWGILLLLLGAGRLIFFIGGSRLPLWADLALLGLLIFAVLYCIIAPAVRYRRYRYYIDAEQVVVMEGLWFVRKDVVPVERIHQISVKRGPIDRMYGLGKVLVVTAGGVVTIRFLEMRAADEITAYLQRRIKGIVQEQDALQAANGGNGNA